MRLTRARYVTICQQFLVTAVVVAVGLSAAGVMTLQIAIPESSESAQAGDLAPAIDVRDAYVDAAPVTPKVRTVKVAPVQAHQRRTVSTAKSDRVGRTAAAGKKLAAVSTPTKVKGFATVGVTWKPGTELAEDDITVEVRTRRNGTWSDWTTAGYHDEHGPDPESAEAARIRPGTDAVVVGAVDQVQMRAETPNGEAPADLELTVVDPGEGEVTKEGPAIDTSRIPAENRDATASAPVTSNAGTASGGEDALALMASKATKPYIFSRGQWGANESLRDKTSLRYGTVKAGFIHHTVNANDYSEQQVPALIRGIYAYHTQSRGWSDIGYNFLVDRFGRIWEGRYGGVDRAVVGAHTLGYNEVSFAMSAIGDYDKVPPAKAVLNAYAKLFAWKLGLYGIPADKTGLYVKNSVMNAINGHRDVGQTACPGRYLYAKLRDIRVAARTVQTTGQLPSSTPALTGDPVNWPILPPPSGVPSPTADPLAALTQPSITFPKRANLTLAPWPDAVLKSSTGRLTILPTDGMLGYGTAVRNTGPWDAKRSIVAVGDVTGDRKGDVLAVAATNGYARIYPGDGRGHVSKTSVAGSSAFAGADLIFAAGDVNRDGRRDVISRGKATHNLYLHRGVGKGAFARATLLRRAWPFTQTTAGDLDRDGRVDLVAVRSGALVFLRGSGATTPATSFATARTMATLPRASTSITIGPDSTGDGKHDVLVRWSNGRASLYAGNGKGDVGQEWGQFSDVTGLSKVSGAQMSGTSAMDVVARDGSGRLVVVPSNGRRNVRGAITSNLRVPGATQVLNVGDWTGNGVSDLIVRDSYGDRLVLWPGVGGGKFGRGRSLGRGWKDVTRLAPVGDVTGDGRPDLMGRVGTGPLLVFPGAGVSAFKAARKAPASMRTFNQIGSALWGADGLMFRSADGSFVPLVGATLSSALQAANGAVETGYDTYLGVGDADGDGVSDVLAREKGTGTLWLLPGKTSGGVSPRMWVANGFAGYQLIG